MYESKVFTVALQHERLGQALAGFVAARPGLQCDG